MVYQFMNGYLGGSPHSAYDSRAVGWSGNWGLTNPGSCGQEEKYRRCHIQPRWNPQGFQRVRLPCHLPPGWPGPVQHPMQQRSLALPWRSPPVCGRAAWRGRTWALIGVAIFGWRGSETAAKASPGCVPLWFLHRFCTSSCPVSCHGIDVWIHGDLMG